MPKIRQIGHGLEGKVCITGVYRYINHKKLRIAEIILAIRSFL